VAYAHAIEIYAPDAGDLEAIHVTEGATVAAGDLLFSIRYPAVESELREAEISQRLIEAKIDRRVADEIDRSESIILLQSLIAARERVLKLRNQIEQGEIRASFSGIIVDLPRDLHPGRAISPQLALARLVEPKRMKLVSFVPEADISRISSAAKVVFIADDPAVRKMKGRVKETFITAETDFDTLILSSQFGGRIDVVEDSKGEIKPEQALFEVLSDLEASPSLERQVRGVTFIEAEPRSIAHAFLRRVAGVLLREADF
jgi:putative peptide zinc metalloprotease protein